MSGFKHLSQNLSAENCTNWVTRDKPLKNKGKILTLLLSLILSQATLAADSAVSQVDAQKNSFSANDVGSDESLKHSATHAMQALMNLSSGQIPSAVNQGYKAYGQYRNAENLDRMKNKNAAIANSMGSVGSAPVIAAPAKTNTSFRRLDPSFLRDGEFDKVAAEFERQTGMSRTEFLHQMSEVSEKKISRYDPMMIDKAFSRFEDFLKKVPNAQFRKNAEKNVAMVPETVRKGIVAKAVTKLAGFFADIGSSPAPAMDPSLSAAAPAPAGPQEAATAPAAPAMKEAEDRKPAAAQAIPAPENASEEPKDGFGNIVAAALETQGSPEGQAGDLSIFQQVSRRYRILTPLIVQH